MKRHFLKIVLPGILFLSALTVRAAEWQWSVPVTGFISPETKSEPLAFLWIPSEARQLKAVIIGQHNMLEEGILEHPYFRKRLASLSVAEIWISPGIDQVWASEGPSPRLLQKLLDRLAEVSGYEELKNLPVIPMGHSAMATFPWNYAASDKARTLAVLSIHGDSPSTNLTGYGRSNLDWGKLEIDGIPGLMVEGEYEWWEARVQPGLDFMKQHPGTCMSFLCDAGRGHFDYSEQLVQYLALFVEKAMKYRLPEGFRADRPYTLLPVDKTKGWLADRWHPDSLPQAKAAPYQQYTGDKDNAFWYFDQEMARLTERIYAEQRGKKPQYLGFCLNGKRMKYQPEQFARYVSKLEPQADGLTFHLSSVFLDSLHQNISNEHARVKTHITRISGAVEKLNDTTFTVRFSRMGLNNTKRTANFWLMAANDGDRHYKSAVQQIYFSFPYRNLEGQAQKIEFDSLPDVKAGTSSMALHATSTSRLKVHFYIQEGPAKIVNDRLVFTKIPIRSAFPIKVTVVAWQHGRNAEPKVATAEPVVRSFYIRN